jgi:hypothetical protein
LSLTRIFSVLWANVVIACVEYILIHERRTGRDLSEEGDLDRFANLDSLALLHKDLACVLAAVFAIEGWDTVLLGVMTLFEGLKGGHEVMPTCNTVCDDTLCDTGGDGSFDNGGDGVHGTDDL